MNYCESCQQIEGDVETDEDGETVCKECGEPITRLREALDDYEMER